MSKSILVIDTPDNCEKCVCAMTVYGKLHCPPRDTVVRKSERDCACPLIQIPEPVDPAKAKCTSEASMIEGWNDCLKALLGSL